MMVFPSSAVYSVTTPISEATNLTVNDLTQGTGAMFLFYGWGCIVWQALALQYGKRPAYLVSLGMSVIIMAVTPLCTTVGAYTGVKILQGFFGAPVESLCEISMTDIVSPRMRSSRFHLPNTNKRQWFAHERPLFLAVYGLTLAASGKLSPVFAAFINAGQGWKWTIWWCSIGIGIAFVYCFFLMEETNYDRVLPAATFHADDSSNEASAETMTEKSVAVNDKTPATDSATAVEAGQIMYPRKTYLQKLSLTGDKKRPNRLVAIMVHPFKFFTFPVVVWAGVMYGTNGLVWPGILNAVASATYTGVYGFSSKAVGFAYLGAVVGMVLGSLWVSLAGPALVMRLARRNNGVAEPEHILWLFLASLVTVPFAMILWGVGGSASPPIHWFGMVFAQCILAISSTLCLSTAIQYASSTYRDLAGELITTIVLIRNTLSFAINYGITPWIDAQGTRDCFITVAVLALVVNGTMFVFIRYGKRMRGASAERYWKLVENARAHGLGH